MNKVTKKLLTFSLPAIIFVIVFVYSYHQNLIVNNDDSSDTIIAKIELPLKNINTYDSPLFFILNSDHFNFIPELFRESPVAVFLSKNRENLINTKNNSPPINTCV